MKNYQKKNEGNNLNKNGYCPTAEEVNEKEMFSNEEKYENKELEENKKQKNKKRN